MSDFAKEVRELWTQGEEADEDNRKEALSDLEFAAGEQWDDEVRAFREEGDRPFPLPCLTINQLPQFIGQVVGDRRANQTSIKVLPREDGDKEVAEVRSELIRSIEHQSKADRIYTQAFEQAVTCGMGNFRIDLDYAYEDVFERDLFIRGIPNPMAVNWDPMAADPTAKDAKWCFVTDKLPLEEYKERYPDAAPPSMFDSEAQSWIEDNTVRVAEYWRLSEKTRTIAMLQPLVEGGEVKVEDVTDKPEADWRGRLVMNPATGKPMMRDAKVRYATMVMTNGMEELTKPFELKIPRLPIIRVMGRETWIGEKRVRFGLVRFARDPQRLKNYWRSVVAELLMGAPRANFVAFASAIKGRESDWPNTLIANDNSQLPVPVTGQNLAAFINEAAMCAQDMKDVTGLHDASLGMKGNETSGVAIQRRQNEGDIATIGYHDNMNAAMQEAGEVLNALIPIVYDTARTIRVIGEDDSVRLLRVNDPNFVATELVKDNVDIGKGRYDISISTGPTYATKRQEGAAQLMELAGRSKAMDNALDLVVRTLDIPYGDEIAERVKPEGAGDPEDMTPEQMQAAMLQRQMAQMAQQMEMASAQATLAKAQAEARKATAEAIKAEAEAALASSATRLRREEADADKAEAEADKAEAEAVEAQVDHALTGAHLTEMASEPEEIGS